ncbi:hypothetical protein CHUAL_011700 [Chamberlinius hualienensis]
MQRSDVYRMVHEEDSEGKSSPSSPQPTFRPYMYSRNASGSSSPSLQSQSFLKLQQSIYGDREEYTSSEEEEEETSSPTPYRQQQPAPAPPPKPAGAQQQQYSQQQVTQVTRQTVTHQQQIQQQRTQQTSPQQHSIIPVENSTSPTPHQNGTVNEIQWSPTSRRRPIWPPPKNEPVLSTSSQSMKFAGGRPAKQFIWPPPKDFVEVSEEIQGNQRNVIYRHVPEDEANKSKVYVSSRAPAKLAAAAWEPYSQSYGSPSWNRGQCPSKRLRRFDDIFSSNSTPLPPTYRVPPGTFHVAT